LFFVCGIWIISSLLEFNNSNRRAGTESHASIVKSFGADIVDADNRINRQKLGAIVFRDASQMKKLTDIVWPAINQLAQSDMKQLEDQGSKVVVRAILCSSFYDLR
jgi:dephospho-CoA kinase